MLSFWIAQKNLEGFFVSMMHLLCSIIFFIERNLFVFHVYSLSCNQQDALLKWVTFLMKILLYPKIPHEQQWFLYEKYYFFLQVLILFTIFADVLLWMAGDESLVR